MSAIKAWYIILLFFKLSIFMNKTDEQLLLRTSQTLQKNRSIKTVASPLAVFICFIFIWWFVCKFNIFPSYALPSPEDVLKSFKEEIIAGRLINDIVAS